MALLEKEIAFFSSILEYYFAGSTVSSFLFLSKSGRYL
jgi:hypothetical protein